MLRFRYWLRESSLARCSSLCGFKRPRHPAGVTVYAGNCYSKASKSVRRSEPRAPIWPPILCTMPCILSQPSSDSSASRSGATGPNCVVGGPAISSSRCYRCRLRKTRDSRRSVPSASKNTAVRRSHVSHRADISSTSGARLSGFVCAVFVRSAAPTSAINGSRSPRN